MNKKILMGLLVSFIACNVVMASEPTDSPMTRLMKQRKTYTSSTLVKSTIKRTRALESEKGKLARQVSTLESKTKEQQIQITFSSLNTELRNAARTELVNLLSEDTAMANKLEELLQNSNATSIKDLSTEDFEHVPEDELLLAFATSAPDATSFYYQKLADLQTYISSSTGLMHQFKSDIEALSNAIVNKTQPTKQKEQIQTELLAKLKEEFGKTQSVKEFFLAAMKSNLEVDEEEAKEEESSSEEEKGSEKPDDQTKDLF